MCDGTHSLINFLLVRQSFQQLYRSQSGLPTVQLSTGRGTVDVFHARTHNRKIIFLPAWAAKPEMSAKACATPPGEAYEALHVVPCTSCHGFFCAAHLCGARASGY